VLGLDNMREMLDRLGNPQDAVPYVHVAGTNGKGSVIAYLYTTLTRAGYKVGRYISPTLYSYRERLEIADEKISQEDFAKYVTEISRSIDQMTAVGMNHPTPFEIETAAAFLYFKEENCDLVLLETGIVTEKDTYEVYEKLNEIEKSLKNCKMPFLRVHQSFLVNYRHVDGLAYDFVIMDNGKKISISEDRRKMISEQYCSMEDTFYVGE